MLSKYKKAIITTTLLAISTYSFADMKDCALASANQDDKDIVEYCTPYLKDKNNPEATASLAGATKSYKKSLDYSLWYANFYDDKKSQMSKNETETYTSALNIVGNIYYFGQAGKADKAKGLEYITKAASLGNDFAQKQLGGMYVSGQNGEITTNIATGYKWTEIAIANGSQDAKNGYLSVNLDGFKKETPYCIGMGEQLVAQAYLDGTAGLSKDKSKAKKYLSQAIAIYKDNEPTKESYKYCAKQKGLDLASAEKLLGSL